MELVAGKSYVTRDGRKATVYRTDLTNSHNYPVLAVVESGACVASHQYAPNGCWSVDIEHCLDIVGPWVEHVFVNLYAGGCARWHSTPEEAIAAGKACAFALPLAVAHAVPLPQ